jgi:hypothetical protein
MQMSNNPLNDATHEMEFCGGYLFKYGAVSHWTENAGTKRYMLEEMLKFADRVAVAAEIIRKEIDKGSAD